MSSGQILSSIVVVDDNRKNYRYNFDTQNPKDGIDSLLKYRSFRYLCKSA